MRELAVDARRWGASAAEIYAVRAVGIQARVQRGRLGHREAVDEARAVVRCWDDAGRLGLAEGPLEQVRGLLSAAVSAAGRGPVIPPPSPVASVATSLAGLSTFDRRWHELAEDERVGVLIEAEREARAVDAAVSPEAFAWSDRAEHRAWASSSGAFAEEEATRFELSGLVSVDGGGGRLRVSDSLASRYFASAAGVPFGAPLARRALHLTRPAPAPEGAVRALLPQRVVAALIDAFAAALLRRDPWTLGFRAHPSLHLVDDRGLVGGLRSAAFDDRGAPPRPLVLVQHGRTEAPWRGSDEARAAGGAPTGHERDGALALGNLVLRRGARSVAVALADSGAPTLMVDDLTGFEAADPNTGAWSGSARGRLVSGGVGRPCVGARVQGSWASILGAQADLEVLADADRLGHVDAPALLLGALTIR
jgi:predicted Zn-dependent protease